MPRRQEPGQRLGLDRLDLAPQRGQRAPPQLAQHVALAPLPAHALGAELAAHDAAVGLQRHQHADDATLGHAEAVGDLALDERAVGAGVAPDEILQRPRHRLGERLRQPQRQRAPERVAVARRVVGGGPADLAGHDDLDGPLLGQQLGQPRLVAGLLAAQVELGRRQVADPAQDVVQLVGAAGPAAVGQALQVELDVGEHAGVEQLAQLLGAEQVAQQVAVEGQRSGPPLGQRGVALVHVGGDPVEQQALGHRAGLGRVDGDDAHGPAAQLAEHLAQRRHVEHVLQALPRRLEQDRERRVLGGHGQQVGRPLALLPQRRALVGPAARQQQGPPGALPEPRREQRRLRQRGHDQLLDVLGVDHHGVERQLVGRLGQAQHDAVVAPHRLDRHVVLVGQPALDGHRPRRVHRRAERAEQADPPVADLVAEALDDDRAVVGHDTGGLGLLGDVLQQVGRRQLVEGVVLAQHRGGLGRRQLAQLAHERAERPAQLERPARPVAVPERHLPRLARRRRDGDLLERDVLDAPRRRAEHERLAGPALVDHLLVELADRGCRRAGTRRTGRGRGSCRRT